MSSKKRTPKSSGQRRNARVTKAALALYRKKWNREADAADKRFFERERRWPTKNELAFWDTHKRFPKKGELAALTRAAKQAKAKKRKAAAKKAAETRATKSPETRKWEKERRDLQKLQNQEISKLEEAGIKWPLRFHRWYDSFYISLSKMSIDDIHALLLALKKRRVQAFRIEREVTIGDRGKSDMIAPSGFVSTKFQFMGRLARAELRHGNARTGLPSLQSMRMPGQDIMRYLVIDTVAVRDGFPTSQRKIMLSAPRETRDTISNKDDEAFYLKRGKKPNATQKKLMREARARLDAELEDLDDDSEGE